MPNNNVAIRKQTQINQAGKTMFLWVAVASVLVGVAAVVGIFLFQKLVYTEKVLAEKQNTVSALVHNLSVIDNLKNDVRALNANSALLSVRANDSDQAMQVVLDALPSEPNSLALGASLQSRLLSNIPGKFALESLQVIPVTGAETAGNTTTVDASASAASNVINFSFSVKGDQQALQAVLRNLERSIRTIVVTNMSLETQGQDVALTVSGKAFYQPGKVLQLTDKQVPVK